MKQAPKKYVKSMWLIKGLLNQALGNTKTSQADLDYAIKVDSFATDFLTKNVAIKINSISCG